MTASNHFVGKVTQKAIVYRDGKVLLTRDVGDSNFELPGGRLDMDEDVRIGLEREMHEELHIEVVVKDPVFVCQTVWGRDRSPHYFVAFSADLISPIEAVRPDGVEVEEMRWVTQDEMKGLAIYQECVDAINEFYRQHG